LSALFTSVSPNVFTSFTPFSFSISVSFGNSGLSTFGTGSHMPNHHDYPRETGQQEQKDETYVPQAFVIGAFMAIFFAQVGVNFLQVVRTGRRRRRVLEMQFPQPLPQRNQNRGPTRDTGVDANAGEQNLRPPDPGTAAVE
jgi:hypothetical protein